MKIVICGAGLVGNAIARHLAAEGNDVTVIDQDGDRLQRLVDIADVGAVQGVALHLAQRQPRAAMDAQILPGQRGNLLMRE